MSDFSDTQATRGLATPTIPQAHPVDGLLTLEAMQHPVTLTFPLWDYAMPTDYNQLLVNGVPTGNIKTIVDEQPGDIISLEVPPELLENDGIYAMGYRGAVVDGLSTDSAFVPMIVDRTAPGGRLLAPLIFEQDLSALTPATQQANGNALTARLPGYFDAKWGDVVRTYWGEQAGPVYTLTAEDPGSDKITFTFDSHFVEQLAKDEVAVTYTVTDRAGNVSKVSEPAVLRYMQCKQPEPMNMPVKLCFSLCQCSGCAATH